jgi:hypothetical protein
MPITLESVSETLDVQGLVVGFMYFAQRKAARTVSSFPAFRDQRWDDFLHEVFKQRYSLGLPEMQDFAFDFRGSHVHLRDMAYLIAALRSIIVPIGVRIALSPGEGDYKSFSTRMPRAAEQMMGIAQAFPGFLEFAA